MKVRLSGLVSAVERLVGARPGPRFQVDMKGMGSLENTIRRSTRRISLAITAAAAIISSGFTLGDAACRGGCLRCSAASASRCSS